MCVECYVDEKRITPLLNPIECLQNHMQYICGTCGRCICIEKEPKRGLQRWNFPFKSLEIAKMYLRTADYSMKKSCGIYEIESENGRRSYKILLVIMIYSCTWKRTKANFVNVWNLFSLLQNTKNIQIHKYENWLLMKYSNICQNDKYEIVEVNLWKSYHW